MIRSRARYLRVMVTWYLTVRHDAGYSRSTPTAALVEHLRTFPELVAVGPMEFLEHSSIAFSPPSS